MDNDDYNWLLILLISFSYIFILQSYHQSWIRYHQLSTI